MTLNTSVFTPTREPNALPGLRILGLEAKSEVQLVEALDGGLSPESAERLARHLNLSLTRLLELAGIKSSTYHDRKKRGRPLSPEESERIYRLAKLAEAAEGYFEDRAAAQRWLEHPKVALGGRSPLAFGRTAEGAAYVLALLGRMAHGVIS